MKNHLIATYRFIMLQFQIEISIAVTHKIKKFSTSVLKICCTVLHLSVYINTVLVFSYNKNNIYITKRDIEIEIVFIFVDSFEVNNLSLHKLPLQLQIVAFVLPISILLQLFADFPLPQPNPRTEIKKTSIRS